MIDRRRFVAITAASAVLVTVPTKGQPAKKVWRIGFLSTGSPPARTTPDPADAFWQRLRELGYVEGTNLVVEKRFADGRIERLPELAAEVVRLNPDLIVTRGSIAGLTARKATGSIPVVMASSMDPVREGIVASLARPGGNVTGMMFASDTGLIAKRLQFLKEAVPRASRLAIAPGAPAPTPASVNWVKDSEDAARALGVQTQTVWVPDPASWHAPFAEMAEGRADALSVAESPSYISYAKHIADLALKYLMPTMFGAREHVEAGGLMSYGLDLPAVFRRAAELVDKVLKGAKPADMPIEQPTKYELVINLRTAKALGIALPSSLVATAEVIQ
jgi:putative ABC transport system substrate-binding protein